MPVTEIETDSLESCARLGHALAAVLRAGDLLLLDGPLGAGKTTLVHAIAAGLGLDTAPVSSPTFVMVNEYTNPAGPDLIHVDAYRLRGADEEELDLLGWDRVIDGTTIAIIEWADRVRTLLDGQDAAASIEIEPTGETSRLLRLDLPEAWSDRPAFGELAALANPPEAGPALPDRGDTICPTTGVPVPADSPTWPFIDERARMADLYKWFSESYTLERPIEQADFEQGD